MSIATRARKNFRLVLTTAIIIAMLAVAAPAHADLGFPPGGNTITEDNDTVIGGNGGDGGNGGIGINAVLLNCFLLLVACGDVGPLGGGNANGGNGAPGNAQIFN